MLNRLKISPNGQKFVVYIILLLVTLAIYWQVNRYDFIIEDNNYVTQNNYVQAGITLNGFLWAFSTLQEYLWNPLVWLSLMLDHQLYGLDAGGYHITNLILHMLSTLLLFGLFCRMTGDIWKSAFVAALFALHPIHVESVAWVSERKDVLSAFFWMLTLYLYVLYTEKPAIRRYLLVIFSFALALMSKPMVVTLPLMMILLDYWPLNRFKSQKSNLILWQMLEKAPFFILSAVFSSIALYAQQHNPSTLASRIADASLAFVIYIEKIFWPHNLAFCHPYSIQISGWQVWGAALLIVVISVAVIVMIKRLPYLFIGWFWYAITILPVIGIVTSDYLPFMADHYTYLPSIGISVMLAWGIPLLFPSQYSRKRVLFPSALGILFILAVLTWKQCGYWKDSITLFGRTVQITNDNALAYHHLGFIYDELGQHQLAIDNYNNAIRLKPYYARYYNNRGIAYAKIGENQRAMDDLNHAIRLKPDLAEAYRNKAMLYLLQGNKKSGCHDAQKACELGICELLESVISKGYCL